MKSLENMLAKVPAGLLCLLLLAGCGNNQPKNEAKKPAAGNETTQRLNGGTVNVDNFIRAESDMYMAKSIKELNNLGEFSHNRTIASVDNQPVVRYNRDVLVSSAVFDMDAGPVTITLPDPGKRFLSILVVNEDHYTPVAAFGGGEYKFTRQDVGTRYAMVALRMFADPNNPRDMEAAHALQDKVKVEQPGGPGKFEIPTWDSVSLSKVRDSLLKVAQTMTDFKGAFGTKDKVDPTKHLIGTASGWGGNPESIAIYLNQNPAKNDGSTVYKLHIPADVPVDGFWSVSVYNAKGYFEKNPFNAYNINSTTAKKNKDGSVDIQFGFCDGKVPNCLPIMAGWNYTVRLYRPRPEILNGTWKFPEMQPMK